MRHESHRIEKAVYNNILEAKQSVYREKWERLSVIHQILKDRGYPANEPTIAWSKQIYDAFEVLETDFIQRNSKLAPQFNPNAAKQFVEFLREKRSVRIWAEEQPAQCILEAIAYSMIDAARWAPTSGNRQPWRFVILSNLEDKELLKKVKENHCTSAPLLIFVGMDTRLYGAFGKSERSIYIDAGAAIMQMILLAHKCGPGVCWNHFADDLINSRNINKTIYSQFTKKLNIPEYIAPIAIVAIGYPSFIPPEPARMEIESLVIDSGKHKTLCL
ncbi:hypothetical protein DSM107010_58450 [Chroococcidiopsis cubana SAG 39.79]|uniref:Nitroreductase domain-containing protein n=2 Tax=Chroococcidiopsis TaxID=54298 RepID=A0AB37UB70_9CYAN|nr:hypothetical protein DSM107010_58450 [Chroococcidiopsis cubana SAG 39.79]